MDFEKILPFIIVGIYLFFLFGKKKLSSKESPAQEKSGLQTVFEMIAKQLKEHAEAVKKNAGKKQRQQLEAVKRETPVESWEEAEEIDIDLPVEDSLIEEEEKIIEAVLFDTSEEEIIRKPSKIKKELYQKAFLQKDLQQAVVWSEILAPPVALREDQGVRILKW